MAQRRAPSWQSQRSWVAQVTVTQTPLDGDPHPGARGYLGGCSETQGSFRKKSHSFQATQTFI